MTPNDSPEHRVKTARLACWVTAAVLLLFALTGKLIFRFLGITLPAFQLAASMPRSALSRRIRRSRGAASTLNSSGRRVTGSTRPVRTR